MFGLRWMKRRFDVVLDFSSAIALSIPSLSRRDRSRKSFNIERSQFQKWAITLTADAFVAWGDHLISVAGFNTIS